MSHRRLTLAGLAAAAQLALAAGSAHAATPAKDPLVAQLPNVVIAEGERGEAPFVVNVALNRPNPYSHPVSVGVHDYTTVAVTGSNPRRTYGSAAPDRDYRPVAPFRLEWAPGEQVATFPVKLLGDGLDEPDENVNVRIAAPAGGVTIRDNDVDIVIGDNDPLGTTGPFTPPRVILPSVEIREPDTGCYPYEMSLQLARPVPSWSPEASVGVFDYTPLPGAQQRPAADLRRRASRARTTSPIAPFRLTFAQGESAATFPIEVCGDTRPEGDEEIDVRVAGPDGREPGRQRPRPGPPQRRRISGPRKAPGYDEPGAAGASVPGRCSRLTTAWTPSTCPAVVSSRSIQLSSSSSPRRNTTPFSPLTSTWPLGASASRKISVSTLRASVTSSSGSVLPTLGAALVTLPLAAWAACFVAPAASLAVDLADDMALSRASLRRLAPPWGSR